MKLGKLSIALISSAFLLSACSEGAKEGGDSKSKVVASLPSSSTDANAPSVSSIEENSINNEGDFKLVDSSGNEIGGVNGVYTISALGTYTASGTLEDGYIYINYEDTDANDDEDIEIDLSGATISCSTQSAIYAPNAGDSLKIKAVKGTSNLLKDGRSAKTTDLDDQGEGVIYAKADLSLVGSGTLVVSASYNNGVHTTKDLKLKNQTLQVSAPNNAIKGNDSVTISEGGTFNITSTGGDGIKTENTDLSSSNKQRGSVTIKAGTVKIDAANDGIDAAYDISLEEGTDDDGNVTTPNVVIYSGEYSAPTSKEGGDSWDRQSDYSTESESAKGLKANNEINISAGYLFSQSEDDAIHVNYGDSFDSGSTGIGTVNISGGELELYSGDDAIHVDNTLNISGGTVNVKMAYEGLEGNFINVSGGSTYVYGVDDGLNASKKINKTPYITITGGYLDVTVANSDTDGIDSNGYYVQKGGIVVTRAPGLSGNENMAALDTDSGASISGGTLVLIGAYEDLTSSSGVYSKVWGSSSGMFGGTNTGGNHGPGGGRGNSSSSNASISLSSGTVSFTPNSGEISFSIDSSCSMLAIYSNDVTSGSSYAIYNNGSSVASWSVS